MEKTVVHTGVTESAQVVQLVGLMSDSWPESTPICRGVIERDNALADNVATIRGPLDGLEAKATARAADRLRPAKQTPLGPVGPTG